MTNNNLAVHLKWLLKQGPSLYPSLSASTLDYRQIAAHAGDQSVTNTHQITGQSVPEVVSARVLGNQVHTTTASRPVEEKTLGDGLEAATDSNMARLVLAPSSATKHAKLSFTIVDKSKVQKSPIRRGPESPLQQRDGICKGELVVYMRI